MWELASRRCGRGRRDRLAVVFATQICIMLAQAACPLWAAAGPYSGPAYYAGDMIAWATQVESLERGPVDIADPTGPVATFGAAADALGPADVAVVSLGDGGRITLGFAEAIGDGPGDDFAVFENGFLEDGTSAFFAEFAFVEVSSNGSDFARFEAVTLHDQPVFAFGTVDPSDFDNLAGDQPQLFGTGFDLAELAGHPLVAAGLLDLQAVDHVRVVDVVGNGTTQDSLMSPVFDPYPTPFPVGGFDVDAVGILNEPQPAPEPGFAASFAAGLAGLVALARRRSRRAARVASLALALALAAPALARADFVIDFEDQGLAEGEFDNGSDGAGGFVSRGVLFENSFTDFGGGFSGWTGFSASAVRDTTTAGYGNQYAAYDLGGSVAGSGAGDSIGYGVFFDGAERMVLPFEATVASAWLTNGTYPALSMLSGDGFAKKFGGPSGDDPDWFLLTITGYDALGGVTGQVDFDLADFAFVDPALDYVVDAWTLVDLSSLGPVKSLGFSFSGSDVGTFGLNTPAYVAIDDVTVVPEPGTALLVGVGLALVASRRRAV